MIKTLVQQIDYDTTKVHRELQALGVEVIEYPVTFCAKKVIHLELHEEADEEVLVKYIKKTFDHKKYSVSFMKRKQS